MDVHSKQCYTFQNLILSVVEPLSSWDTNHIQTGLLKLF
jgi:hypothetical protein